MAVGEFDLIKRYFARSAHRRGVALGIGDDCALLDIPAGKQLAVSMDTLVAGVHFPADASSRLIAERALRVNLSDLAAMGAEPLWFTLGLTLPEANPDWLKDFSVGLFAAADEFNCVLVGGDTTRGPLSMTLQVHGAVDSKHALRRSGARIGDLVCVTGCLGDGAAALAVIQDKLWPGAAAREYLLDRFYRPRPQLVEGQLLLGLASAALDISDGLVADLGHICECSKVGAVIDMERLPLSNAMRANVGVEQAKTWALAGGDDYQLCFTLPPAKQLALQAFIDSGQLQATIIGEIVAGSGVICRSEGVEVNLSTTGYNHF
jgi:thiamine-monophosphate kinase